MRLAHAADSPQLGMNCVRTPFGDVDPVRNHNNIHKPVARIFNGLAGRSIFTIDIERPWL